MRSVKVQKSRLLEALHENKESHIADFEIAWEAFRSKALDNAERIVHRLEHAERGEPVELWVGLDPPVNHADDYDRAIEMVDWELANEVTLTEQEFQQYVQDKWGWSGQVSTSNLQYTGSVSPSKT